MVQNRNGVGNELRKLRSGIFATIVGDAIAAGIGALIGGVLSYLFLDMYGNSFRLGALVGAIAGVLLRSLVKPLFSYRNDDSIGKDDQG